MPKALVGMKRWDAQGGACGMPKGEEKRRRREGMGGFYGGMGLLVWISRDLRGDSFK